MNSISIRSLLLGCILVIATSNTAVAQNEYEDQVLAQLESVAEVYLDAGYEPLVWTGDMLEDGDSELFTVTLSAGSSYALVGVCDVDCSDLDLSLFDDEDNLIVEDVEVDDAPIVEFEVLESGDFTLDVTMFDCSEDICYYGVALIEL